MKLILMELRKIYNLKLLLFLVVFTLLYTNLFLMTVNHPEDSASCVAQNTLVDILQKEYGYDTTLPYEDDSVLDEIREKQIEKLDRLVQRKPVLQKAGITTWQQLSEVTNLDTVSDEIMRADREITFDEGMEEVFLIQTIDSYREEIVLDIESGKALSLFPDSALFHTSQDFPKMGILMILSSMILILPYQIRERLSGVTGLQVTTKTGRSIWKKQFLSAMLSSLPIIVMQVLIFILILKKTGILDYAHFSVSGSRWSSLWFDMTFGEYLMVNSILYIVIALASAAMAFLISRLSENYVIGIAAGLPTAFILGMLCSKLTANFLQIFRGHSYITIIRPVTFAALMTVTALAINMILRRWDKKRDIIQ